MLFLSNSPLTKSVKNFNYHYIPQVFFSHKFSYSPTQVNTEHTIKYIYKIQQSPNPECCALKKTDNLHLQQ